MEDPKTQAGEKNQQEPTTYINIGRVGPGSAVGKGNSVKAKIISENTYTMTGASLENPTRDDFVALLQKMQVQITQLSSQLTPDDAKDVKDALAKAAEMSTRDNPPADRLQQNLATVRTIVEDTAKTGAAFAPLVVLIQQAFTMFTHLFVK